MDELIRHLIKSKTRCFFISPHLDDAMFSAGELMLRLAGKTNITVINIFTSCGGGRNTLSAKSYLQQVEFANPKHLFNVRIKEDKAALDKVHVRVINLSYADALWRKKDKNNFLSSIIAKKLVEFDRLYPVYRLSIIGGKIHHDDLSMIDEITIKVRKLVGNQNEKFKIFCPLGIGQHVDHLIVREICHQNFKSTDVIYWADFPYHLSGLKTDDFSRNIFLKQKILKISSEKKKELVLLYHSQADHVIKDLNLLKVPEYYYFSSENVF